MLAKKRKSAFSVKAESPVPPPPTPPAEPEIKSKNKKRKRKPAKKPEPVSKSDHFEKSENGSFLDVSREAEISATEILKRIKQNEKIKLAEVAEEDSGMVENGEEESKETLSKTQAPPPQIPIPSFQSDSLVDSTKLFSWLIYPLTPEDFMQTFWEQKATLIRRNNLQYYADFFSTKQLAEILEKNPVQFGVNLDVTSWDAKVGRQTHNPPGRAYPTKVWDYFNNGCSLRMLNPQTFSNSVWKMCSGLQEFFGCFVGANTYLTPPSTQGFAPHYDDVEVFMLQVEGRKRWKVYPNFENDQLPRKSSRNYHPNEVKQKMEIYEILNPGDVLYVPRGWIHQGECLAGEHSLHVTISTYQKNAWADLLEKIVPRALETAIKENVEYRRGLPTDYKMYMGVSNSDREDMAEHREMFTNNVVGLMQNLITYADVDKACDQVATDNLHCSLPPPLNKDEYSRTIKGDRVIVENGVVKKSLYQIDENSEVRIIRLQSVRVVMEDDTVMLYHNYENPRIYKKEELKGFEITSECAAVMDVLTANYPKYTKISDLASEEQKLDETLQSVFSLIENGVLMTKDLTK